MMRRLPGWARAAIAFLAPEAFEQRARNRERRKLADEIEEIEFDRAYNTAREAQIVSRLRALNRLDSLATCNATRQAARGTYVFLSGHTESFSAAPESTRWFWTPGRQKLAIAGEGGE